MSLTSSSSITGFFSLLQVSEKSLMVLLADAGLGVRRVAGNEEVKHRVGISEASPIKAKAPRPAPCPGAGIRTLQHRRHSLWAACSHTES